MDEKNEMNDLLQKAKEFLVRYPKIIMIAGLVIFVVGAVFTYSTTKTEPVKDDNKKV